MVERTDDDRLTEILKAASDPTRRAILTILAQEGPARVTDLAARFDMSLNSVSKHIKALERAGLVSRRTAWREHVIAPEMAPVSLIDDWFGQLRSSWEMRLDRLTELMTKEDDMTTDLALKVTRRIAASPERLFDAWLDPAMLRRFVSPGAGASTVRAETDPRPGGRFDIVMRNEMGDIPHWGEYREIDRPRRLSFTWNSPHAVPDSIVTITFRALGDETEVTLVHDRFPSDAARAGHERGWTSILDALAQTLEATA